MVKWGFFSADISDSECIRTELTQYEGDIPYMFDETTPVKVCGDLAHSAAGSGTVCCLQYSIDMISFPKLGGVCFR